MIFVCAKRHADVVGIQDEGGRFGSPCARARGPRSLTFDTMVTCEIHSIFELGRMCTCIILDSVLSSVHYLTLGKLWECRAG